MAATASCYEWCLVRRGLGVPSATLPVAPEPVLKCFLGLEGALQCDVLAASATRV